MINRNTLNKKPLLEQILDEMFNNLKNEKEFDNELIEQLKKLTNEEELSEVKILDIIKSKTVKDFEDTRA